jgi:Putative metal-binding motif
MGSAVYRAAAKAVVLALSLGAYGLTGCSLDRGALIEARRGTDDGGGAGAGSGNGAGDAAAGSGNAGASGNASSGNGADAGAEAGSTGGSGPAIDVCGGCDDGIFCNGVERCAPNDVTADARGCISSPACHSNQLCDEAADSCATDCSKNGDADGDGYDAVSCGGDDCNDAALAAHPDGVELCDGLDNDCNSVMDDGFAQLSCIRDKTLASCVFGHCVISACDQGYADCDGAANNGCEQQLDVTPGDCQTADCMGVASADDSDTPADDDNECTLEYCSSGVAVVEDAPDDTACDKDKSVCSEGVCQ